MKTSKTQIEIAFKTGKLSPEDMERVMKVMEEKLGEVASVMSKD